MEDTVYLDVRAKSDFDNRHIKGSINLPPEELFELLPTLNLNKSSKIIVYCYSGARSNFVINLLKDQGYTNLVNGINIDHVEKNITNLEQI